MHIIVSHANRWLPLLCVRLKKKSETKRKTINKCKPFFYLVKRVIVIELIDSPIIVRWEYQRLNCILRRRWRVSVLDFPGSMVVNIHSEVRLDSLCAWLHVFYTTTRMYTVHISCTSFFLQTCEYLYWCSKAFANMHAVRRFDLIQIVFIIINR